MMEAIADLPSQHFSCAHEATLVSSEKDGILAGSYDSDEPAVDHSQSPASSLEFVKVTVILTSESPLPPRMHLVYSLPRLGCFTGVPLTFMTRKNGV